MVTSIASGRDSRLEAVPFKNPPDLVSLILVSQIRGAGEPRVILQLIIW